MIKVTFFRSGDDFTGYELCGHSGYGEEGTDIICASVSTAAQFTANYITDFFDIKANVTCSDGYLELTAEKSDNTNRLIDGLYQQLLMIESDYPQFVKIIISEV